MRKHYDEMTYRKQKGIFHLKEDPFAEKSEGISKNYKELLLLLKFLKTKREVKKMNNSFYDL